MPSSHALLGPSGAHRWLVCTPSARFEEQLPNEESIYAEEGTLAHELAALLLSFRSGLFSGDIRNFHDLMEMWQAKIVAFYTREEKEDPMAYYLAMLQHAEDWSVYVIDLLRSEYAPKRFGRQLFIEQEFDLSEYIPQGFGTADGTVRLPKTLHVPDFKFGAGKRVYAQNNPQGMLYALGALTKLLEEFPEWYPETVVVHIYQPRAEGHTSSSWAIDTDELFLWADETVVPAAKLAYSGQGDFIAGDHCGFCNAKLYCRAYYKEFEELLGYTDGREMTPAELAHVIQWADKVKNWAEGVKKRTYAQLISGQKIAGFKLVKGVSRRTFKSEDDVVDRLLGADVEMFEEAKLKSLTALETELGKPTFNKLLGDLIIKQEGGPSVAMADDKRDEFVMDRNADYENVEDLTKL